MENNFKRFLSLLLAFVMVLGMFPVGHAHAAQFETTSVAPEANKTYVICFKADNGDYYAMTSTAAAKNNHGVLLTEKFEGTVESNVTWKLIPVEGGYYLEAANGHRLSLNGTTRNDAFANNDRFAGEVMTLTPVENTENGYVIGNSVGGYVNALGAVAGGNSWGAVGNWEDGTTAYFFEVPEIEVNLTVNETYTIEGAANGDLTGNDVVDVEAEFVPTTVKGYQLAATTIEDGVYIIANTRANKYMVSSDSGNMGYAAGSVDLTNEAALWTVTKVGEKYTIQNSTGKYLYIPRQDQTRLQDGEYLMTINESPTTAFAWTIGNGDSTQHLNDYQGNSVGAYGPADDGGSQWIFYKVEDVPVYTYAGTDALASDATITSGDEYLLVNIRNSNKTLVNQQHPNANASLYLDGTVAAPSINAVWTITEDEGSYYIQDQNGKFLTFSAGGAGTVTFAPTPVSIGWQSFGDHGDAWGITRTANNRKEYLSNYGGGSGNKAGGWHEENDGGSRWNIYTTTATAVGTYDVTVTAKAVGDTSFLCGNAIYTFHVTESHQHNYVGTVTKEPTCTEKGVMTYTCSCGEGTYTEDIEINPDNHVNTVPVPGTLPTLNAPGKEDAVYCNDCKTTVSGGGVIAQLTAKNAKILSNSTVLALADCEYTLGGTEGAYSLTHGGNYYVMPKGNRSNAKIPQGTTNYGTLAIAAYESDGNFVTIHGHNGVDEGYLYFHNAATNPEWNRYSNAAAECAIALFRADEDSTNAAIPGYTQVTAAEMKAGDSYLIAAKHDNGSWYIMVPTNSGTTLDHVAQIVDDAVTHPHDYTTTTQNATCTATGLTTKTCDCGHVHKEIIPVNADAHAWGEPEFTWNGAEATATVTCGNDASHVQDLTVNVTSSSTTGDCQTNIVTTYTATTTFNGVEYTSTNVVTGDKNTAVHTGTVAYRNNEDGTHTSYYKCCDAEIETVAHTWNAGVETAPDFGKDGYTTYTCTADGCGATNVVTDTGSAKVAVAQISGGTKYESLAAAVEAAQSGDSIALLADTTEDIVLDEAVTLYLNNNTLNGQILVKAAATVSNGTVYAANKDAIIIGVKDNANDASVSLTATSLTVTSETDCAVLIYDGTATFNNCSLNSNSTGYAAVQGSGNQFGDITLSGGTVTSKNEVAIYWPHVGTLTAKNNAVITGSTGLYIKQGTANLSGGSITGNGAYAAHTTNGNGGDSTGDAITVDTGATAPVVNLTGVTLNSTNSNLVGIYGGTVNQNGGLNATHDAFRIEAGTLNLNGGFVNAGECAVYIRGGEVNVKATSLKSTSTEYAAVQGNGNYGGNLTVGAGASITSENEVGIYWPGSGKLTVNGGVITGTTGIYAKQGNVTISGGTIKGTGAKADFNHNGNGGDATGDALVLESCSYGTLTAEITGGTFTSANANAVAAYAQNGYTALTGFVSGGTFSTKVEESYCAEGYIPTDADENGNYTVKVGTYVAQIGETKYESLAEAVEKAASGDTVKLLANTNGDGIIINKDITIDLGGYTYTIDGTLVGSAGTKSCGFQILPGYTVTIQNGAIVMDEAAVRGHDNQVGNNFVIQNYADLTLNNVAVTGNSHTSYVVSINSGDVAMTGNTSITTKKADAVAFDVCEYASYTEPTVTVDTTGTITGEIEVTGGELNIEAATINGALDYTAGKVTKAVTVTLAAPEGYEWENNTTLVKKADKVVMQQMEAILESEILMQFTVEIPEALADEAYVVLTKDGRWGKVTQRFDDLTAGVNAVTIGVASGEMTAPITIEVFDGEGNAQVLYGKDGTELGIAPARTVVDYARKVLTNDANSAEKKALAVALVTYGGYAQQMFKVDAEKPAYDLLNELGIAQLDLSAVTANTVGNYTNNQTNTGMGVKASKTEAVLDSYISYRVYLTVEGDINDYTFTVVTPTGTKTLEVAGTAGAYYVEIPEIASGYIDYEYKITVTNAEGDTNVITTSVLAYVRNVLRNTSNTQEKINLAKALYLYNQAADAFFTNN